jgi:hypothetical protein
MASGPRGKPKAFDIVDYVDCAGGVSEEIISSGPSGEFIMRTGPRKPALETLSLPQWSVANLAILSNLVGVGSLDQEGMLDYLSYTTKVYQLIKAYDQVSVFLYDRQYRRHQATFGFRWGTDISHLQSVHLKPRQMFKANHSSGREKQGTGKTYPPRASHTTSGKEICRSFNSKSGCSFENCKYMHTCSHPGCDAKHAAYTAHAKNE